MDEREIRALLEQGLPGASVEVGGDGYHIDISVVSEAFVGKRRVQRQQMVYAALGDAISSGAVHAVNIRAETAAERASGADG